MKRSKSLHLELFRKSLLAGAGATLLTGCDAGEEVEVVTSILDCVEDTPFAVEQCRTAYQQALDESERIGPKYRSEQECESEFGTNQCRANSFGSFTPIMVGYLFANSLWDRNTGRYGASLNPVYRYFRPFSPMHNMLVTADGEMIGRDDDDSFKLKKKSLKKKKSSGLISRGGFGGMSRKMSSSKSSWGG